jgi:predicted amidophosphoribosyltransferase
MHEGNSTPSAYHLFPALKQNIGGYKFKDGRDVRKVLTRWLKT